MKALHDTTALRVLAQDGVTAWDRTTEIVIGNSTLTLNMALLELLQLRCADDGDVTDVPAAKTDYFTLPLCPEEEICRPG